MTKPDKSLSIADRAVNGTNMRMTDTQSLSYQISALSGAVPIEEAYKESVGLPDLFVHILLSIRDSLKNEEESAVAMIDEAIELAFLHSQAYKTALELYRLDHAGRLRSIVSNLAEHLQQLLHAQHSEDLQAVSNVTEIRRVRSAKKGA